MKKKKEIIFYVTRKAKGGDNMAATSPMTRPQAELELLQVQREVSKGKFYFFFDWIFYGYFLLHSRIIAICARTYLNVVGKSSLTKRYITAKAPLEPNLPAITNVNTKGVRSVPLPTKHDTSYNYS